MLACGVATATAHAATAAAFTAAAAITATAAIRTDHRPLCAMLGKWLRFIVKIAVKRCRTDSS